MLRAGLDGPVAAQLAGAAVLTCLAAGLAAFAPLALKFLMDAAASVADNPGPEAWVLVYAGVLASGRLVAEIRSMVFGRAEQALMRGLAHGAFSHALRLPAGYYAGKSTGEIQQVLENGVQGYRILLQHALLTAAPGLLELVLVAGIILAWLDGMFLAVFAAFAAAYGAVFVLTARGVVRAARHLSSARNGANAWLADGLMNQETVRAFCGHGAAARATTASPVSRRPGAGSTWQGSGPAS